MKPLEGTAIVDTTELLAERQEQYGGFDKNAEMAQELNDCFLANAEGVGYIFTAAQKEAMHMMFHKIARYTLGNEKARMQSVEDICGYAELLKRHTK